MKNDGGMLEGIKCWEVLFKFYLDGLFCWFQLFLAFLRSKPILRSKSNLRSRSDLLSKLTPTPSGPERTIQPLSLAPLRFLFPRISRLILAPNEILLPVSTKAPPRLMSVTIPLKWRYLCAKINVFLQDLLGCFLESFSAFKFLFCKWCFSNFAISIFFIKAPAILVYFLKF